MEDKNLIKIKRLEIDCTRSVSAKKSVEKTSQIPSNSQDP